ncbi:MAG: hypothetical protein WD801_14680 [Gemmatimonadaceae bacterium]
MPPTLRLGSIVALAALAPLAMLQACNRGGGAAPSPETATPLSAYAPQRVVVTPTARVRAADTTSWVRQAGSARAVGLRLDSAIATRLRETGLGAHWILPPELERAFERNRTYATNPHQLAVEPIRSQAFEAGKRYGEPLSSQLRTLIALHADARFVLVPVELRFDGARAVLRVVLLDPRFAEARWVGELASDTALAEPTRALDQIAERLVLLFVEP